MTARASDAAAGRGVVRWFRRVARDLPWRRDRDPWATWVSETMLQQTTVDVVRPAFERFMARFPTVAAFAAAEPAEALAAWSGLGYYRRVRFLHRGARAVVDAGGVIPRTAAELRRIPGVGPYTSGAIASLTFGERVPAIDGNTARVLARYEASEADPLSTRGRAELGAAALRLMPPGAAGAFNEALIELGALVCRPKDPACGDCPLRDGCLAHERGTTDLHPVPRRRVASEAIAAARAVVRRGAEVLVVRRDEDASLLAGFDELPGRRLAPGEDPGAALKDALRSLGARAVRVGARVAEAAHVITRHRIAASAYAVTAAWAGRPRGGARFVPARELLGPTVTTETRKLARTFARAEAAS